MGAHVRGSPRRGAGAHGGTSWTCPLTGPGGAGRTGPRGDGSFREGARWDSWPVADRSRVRRGRTGVQRARSVPCPQRPAVQPSDAKPSAGRGAGLPGRGAADGVAGQPRRARARRSRSVCSQRVSCWGRERARPTLRGRRRGRPSVRAWSGRSAEPKIHEGLFRTRAAGDVVERKGVPVISNATPRARPTFVVRPATRGCWSPASVGDLPRAPAACGRAGHEDPPATPIMDPS